jgi:hypothetical protein
MKTRIVALVAALGLTFLAGSASSSVQVFNISGTFDGGGTYSGFYDLDTLTNTVTDWNVSTYLPGGTLLADLGAGRR